MLSDSQLDLGDQFQYPGPVYRVAADPVSGRIVVSGNGLWVFTPDGSAVLAQAPLPSEFAAACFTGPDSVVAMEWSTGRLGRYRITGNQLELQADVPCPTVLSRATLVPMPHSAEIAVCSSGGPVRYLDAGTLAATRDQNEFGSAAGKEFWGSADGRSRALSMPQPSGRPFVRVIWGAHIAVTELAARPMGSMTPADLTTAITAKRGPVPGAAAWPFLELLGDCLELRFGTDVGLADTRPADIRPADRAAAGNDDDVGLVAGQ